MISVLKSPFFVFLFLVAVIGIWVIGLIYFLPFKYWWFDVVVHFLGGLWVFSLVLMLQNRNNIHLVEGNRVVSFFVFLGLVILVGVVWEFLEFIADRYILKTNFTYMRGVYEDTLTDLLMDSIGGAFGFLIYLITNK